MIIDVPTSIDHAAKSDVWNDLQTFVQRVPDGTDSNPTVVRLQPKGQYLSQRTLELVDRHNVSIDPNGATVRATITAPYGDAKLDRTRSHWRFIGGSNVKLLPGGVVGPHTGGGAGTGAYDARYEAQHAVEVLGVDNFETYGGDAYFMWGDGVYLGLDPRNLQPCRNPQVHEWQLHNNGRSGVVSTGSIGARVHDNDIHDIARTIYDIEPGGRSNITQDFAAWSNQIGAHRLNYLSVGRADVEALIFDIHIIGDTLHKAMMNCNIVGPAVGPGRRHGLILAGVKGDTAYGDPDGVMIGVSHWDQVLVAACAAPLEPGRRMQGVKFVDCPDARDVGNVWTQAA